MKRLITLASIIALTAAPTFVTAGGYEWTHETETVLGDVVASEDMAYNMGREMMQDYQSMTPGELRDEFTNKAKYVDRKSVAITESTVTIEEFLQSNGQMGYQPVLNLEVSYRMHEGRY
ncbi:DUF3316 domain-containing protein [Vibrio alginolyticus]|uniref:DUF3316 domain-containing protein n=1 Tax=Vibrio sp. B1FLJ16 TaxID=2751178 RepID=UPI0015F404FF|nr:DUF3316 domain-containing protein [Vibrio sp. B1FLJ16]MCA0934448.1 DUF3316 domain-containing protein [Vibrio alginolyticus]CAD7824098.1 hypothetical protein ACOMICROBIO_EPCKBFOG_04502 [Vibrio sp. B1FLJ16]CAE6953648.1 hypothetical protein ACOMICROBIO_EPCKBFOG_04502 [Vibrio sp. B1FLJ16]